MIGRGAIGQYAIGESPNGLAFVTNAWAPFSEPVRQKISPALAIALIASGPVQTLLPEQGSLTGSYVYQWSEPVRQRPGLRPGNQQFLAYVPAKTQNLPLRSGEVNFAEESQFSKYSYPWSEPVRKKPGTPAYLQRFFTGDTEPIPTSRNMAWFANLSGPVREKIGLKPGLQQFFTGDPAAIPASRGMAWFANFTEPVREKVGTKAALQQAFTADWEFVPGTGEALDGWYVWYSEPVRALAGLKPYLQQYIAYHPRILPNPNVTGTMNAIETNADVAIFAINVYNSGSTASSGQGARVSIVEVPASGGDPVSIRES